MIKTADDDGSMYFSGEAGPQALVDGEDEGATGRTPHDGNATALVEAS